MKIIDYPDALRRLKAKVGGKKSTELANMAWGGPEREATIRGWSSATAQGADCIDFTTVAAVLGLSPNELYLEKPDGVHQYRVLDAQMEDLIRQVERLAVRVANGKDAVAWLRDFFREWNEREEGGEGGLRAGEDPARYGQKKRKKKKGD
jgi:hypothetical protein